MSVLRSHRILGSSGAVLALALAGVVHGAVGCDDDTPAARAQDAGGVVADAANDAGDSGSHAASGKPGITHIIAELAAHGSSDAGAPSPVLPVLLSDYSSAIGSFGIRAPQVYIPGQLPQLGCGVNVVNAQNPPPSAPDEGDLTLDGYTAGKTATGTLPKPAVCKRVQSPLGPFLYSCPFDGLAADDFLTKSATLSVTGTGGADIASFTVKANNVPYDAIRSTTSLSGLTAADLDGSKPLTVDYRCDNGTCDQSALLAIFIELTDGDIPADAGTQPSFPPPKTEGAFLSCVTFAQLNPESFAIPQQALAALPKTWTAARTIVLAATLDQAVTSNDAAAIALAGAIGTFGISVR